MSNDDSTALATTDRILSDPTMTRAWRLDWIDRVGGPRAVLAAMLIVGFALHLIYLLWDCPIDLTGDEAHYWDWSRSLDIAYYSKGPLVAWIIRASCAAFGDVMWAVRLPALVLAVGTTLLTYALVAKLFRSERLALGAVALNHTVPLFVAGSFIMTIDPPFVFCWTAATLLAAVAILDGRKWAWIALGVVAGVGLLAKYAMPLWYVGLLAFLWIDRPSRRWLKTPWPWIALAITLLFFAAPIWWNARHDWVTFRHVGRQTGVTQREGTPLTNPLLMIATQAAIIGPILAGFLVGAIRSTLRGRVAEEPIVPETRRACRFLLTIGGAYFLVVLLASLRVEIEPNWPAPAFVTLVPLGAWWIGRRLRTVALWTPVRGFFWAHVAIGIVLTTFVHNTHLLYPIAARFDLPARKVDLSQLVKARGNAEIGAAVGEALRSHPQAFVLARSYQDASMLGFYVPGQPRVYDIGAHLGPEERTRHSQFDVWTDRDLRSPALVGRDAIFVGSLDEGGVIRSSFASVESLGTITVRRGGLDVRSKKIYVCRDFKGVPDREPGRY